MAGVPSTRRARRAAFPLALLTALFAPAVARGADEPDTSSGVVLARGGVVSGLATDLDGDGGNEVVAVIYPSDGVGPIVVQGWAEQNGTWTSLGRVPLQRWQPGDERPRAATGSDAASVLIVRTAAGPRVMVPVIGAETGVPGGCCLSFSIVDLGPDGLRAELAPPLPGDFAAEGLVAFDLDDDDVDELLATEYLPTSDDREYAPHSYLLRQASSGWLREELPLAEDGEYYLASIGETDGVPGHDVIFTQNGNTNLARVYADQGTLRAEAPRDDGLLGATGGWIAGTVDDRLVLSDESGITLAAWPRGGAPVRLGSADSTPYPTIFVLGDGPEARIVQMTDGGWEPGVPLALRVFDLDLELERSVDAQPLVQELWELNRNSNQLGDVANRLYPQFGPIPNGIGGRPALIVAGELVTLSAAGEVDIRHTRPMLGTSPAGMAGRQSDWVVNGPGWFGLPASVSLYPGSVPEAVLSVVRLDTVVDTSPAAAAGEVRGAAPVTAGSDEVLATGSEGFEVTMTGEPGTLIITSVGSRLDVVEIQEAPVAVPIEPGGRDDEENERIQATMYVVAPSGVVSTTTWEVDVYRQPPDVSVSSASELFSLRSTIRGRVSGGATVTVDGRPVDLDANGAFGVDVDAPIWPREVVIVATDPLGREAVEQLEVIGFVDYRGLPWIPIAGTLTVVAGLVLFVRTPRLRAEERLRTDGDGRLEEIDGDLI